MKSFIYLHAESSSRSLNHQLFKFNTCLLSTSYISFYSSQSHSLQENCVTLDLQREAVINWHQVISAIFLLQFIKLVLSEGINRKMWVHFPRRDCGESAVATGNSDGFLQVYIFIICLPMFPPFIMEQNATPMFSIPFTTVSSTLIWADLTHWLSSKRAASTLLM